MMEWVPEAKLARVTSLDFFGAIGLVPVGYALTALVSRTAEAGDDPHGRLHARRPPLGRAAARALGARGGMMVQ